MANNRNIRKVMADRLIRHADRHTTSMVRAFKGDVDMIDKFLEDQLDLHAIARMIRENKVKNAVRAMGWIDTAVQDVIPTTVWNWAHDLEWN